MTLNHAVPRARAISRMAARKTLPEARDIKAQLLQSMHGRQHPGIPPELEFVRAIDHRWSRHYLYRTKCGSPSPHVVVKLGRRVEPVPRDGASRVPTPQELEYNALLLLHEHLAEDVPGITAVRPLAYLPEVDGLAAEYLPGQNMLSLSLRATRPWAGRIDREWASETSRNGGRLLSAIHRIRQRPPARQECFEVAAFLRSLEVMSTTLDEMIPGSDRRSLEVAQRGTEMLFQQDVDEGITAHLHGDFYPKNLVRAFDGRVYTIDTTLDRSGPVEEDVAKFLVGIQTMRQRVLLGAAASRSAVSIRIGRSFVKGYLEQGRLCRRRLLAFRLLMLLQRWIAMINVSRKTSTEFSGFIERSRINPYMSRHLRSVCRELPPRA